VHPLNELLKKNKKFEWTEECIQAVDALVKAVTLNLVLILLQYMKGPWVSMHQGDCRGAIKTKG
jgi:hypothetical protein